jgi:hypothetical protein
MKKVILIISALVMVLSGVAAVSAYEAHTVNITAKVENAITMGLTDYDFGTVFPEEWLYTHGSVGLSQSAIDEVELQELNSVDVTVYASWKPGTGQTAWYYDPTLGWQSTANYYNWLGNCLYVGPLNGAQSWPRIRVWFWSADLTRDHHQPNPPA